MRYTLKLRIGDKWFSVMKADFIDNDAFRAIASHYACVDGARLYEGRRLISEDLDCHSYDIYLVDPS